MKLAFHAFYAVILSIAVLSTAAVEAQSEYDFSNMDAEIYLEPWLSYQKLVGLESESSSFNELDYLWWLLRKAQTENLLYFYDDFYATVAKAQKLITKDTSIEIQSRLNIYQGVAFQRQGKYSDSQLSLSKALMQAQQANLNRIYIYGKQELAYTKTLTELFETSLEDIQEAYVEAFALNDQFLIATINETYGAIYGYLQDYEKSIEYYQRALITYKRLKYRAHIAEAIYGLASTYRYWKKYDLAIEYFQLYQEKISYTPNTNITFFAAYGLGMTFAEKGDCEQAIKVIDQALAFTGLVDYNAELYKRKSSCLISLGQLDAAEIAIFNAAKAFSNVPEIMGTAWQLEVIKISGELAHARGNYPLGYQMLEQYYDKYTALLKKNSSNRLLKVRAALEIDRQQIAHALAQERSQVEVLKIEQIQTSNALQIYFNITAICIVLVIGAVIVVQHRNNKKMQLLTIKDSLSNLYNRRYVFERLDDILCTAKRGKTELAVIIIDIDDFKIINDKFGHPVGDDVIKQIAKLSLQALRKEDIMGRIGGEEFLCILPRTALPEAKMIAERLRKSISQHKMLRGIEDIITVSIGIACLSAHSKDGNELYINADQALYQAKALGKNKVVVFEPY
jgi:diguanylate cyclase (GGDEF)-like protein